MPARSTTYFSSFKFKTAIASKHHTIINNFARVEVSKVFGPLPVFRRLSTVTLAAHARRGLIKQINQPSDAINLTRNLLLLHLNTAHLQQGIPLRESTFTQHPLLYLPFLICLPPSLPLSLLPSSLLTSHGPDCNLAGHNKL